MPAVKTSASSPPSDRGQGADLLGRAVDEIVDGQARGGLGAGEQVAHVVADAGDAEQPGLLVEERLDFFARTVRASGTGAGRRPDRAPRAACPCRVRRAR